MLGSLLRTQCGTQGFMAAGHNAALLRARLVTTARGRELVLTLPEQAVCLHVPAEVAASCALLSAVQHGGELAFSLQQLAISASSFQVAAALQPRVVRRFAMASLTEDVFSLVPPSLPSRIHAFQLPSDATQAQPSAVTTQTSEDRLLKQLASVRQGLVAWQVQQLGHPVDLRTGIPPEALPALLAHDTLLRDAGVGAPDALCVAPGGTPGPALARHDGLQSMTSLTSLLSACRQALMKAGRPAQALQPLNLSSTTAASSAPSDASSSSRSQRMAAAHAPKVLCLAHILQCPRVERVCLAALATHSHVLQGCTGAQLLTLIPPPHLPALVQNLTQDTQHHTKDVRGAAEGQTSERHASLEQASASPPGTVPGEDPLLPPAPHQGVHVQEHTPSSEVVSAETLPSVDACSVSSRVQTELSSISSGSAHTQVSRGGATVNDTHAELLSHLTQLEASSQHSSDDEATVLSPSPETRPTPARHNPPDLQPSVRRARAVATARAAAAARASKAAAAAAAEEAAAAAERRKAVAAELQAEQQRRLRRFKRRQAQERAERAAAAAAARRETSPARTSPPQAENVASGECGAAGPKVSPARAARLAAKRVAARRAKAAAATAKQRQRALAAEQAQQRRAAAEAEAAARRLAQSRAKVAELAAREVAEKEATRRATLAARDARLAQWKAARSRRQADPAKVVAAARAGALRSLQGSLVASPGTQLRQAVQGATAAVQGARKAQQWVAHAATDCFNVSGGMSDVFDSDSDASGAEPPPPPPSGAHAPVSQPRPAPLPGPSRPPATESKSYTGALQSTVTAATILEGSGTEESCSVSTRSKGLSSGLNVSLQAFLDAEAAATAVVTGTPPPSLHSPTPGEALDTSIASLHKLPRAPAAPSFGDYTPRPGTHAGSRAPSVAPDADITPRTLSFGDEGAVLDRSLPGHSRYSPGAPLAPRPVNPEPAVHPSKGGAAGSDGLSAQVHS